MRLADFGISVKLMRENVNIFTNIFSDHKNRFYGLHLQEVDHVLVHLFSMQLVATLVKIINGKPQLGQSAC